VLHIHPGCPLGAFSKLRYREVMLRRRTFLWVEGNRGCGSRIWRWMESERQGPGEEKAM